VKPNVNSSLGLLIKELPDMVLPMHGLVMPVDSLLASENDQLPLSYLHDLGRQRYVFHDMTYAC
jgi:hypothetical protein